MCGREIAKALPTMSSCLTSSRAPGALHGTARPHASPVWVLLSVCLAALAMPLSFTGPAVALSALREALGGGPLALNWVTNAFMLSFGATLMAAGALADLHGRRRVFLTGLGVVLASALAQACLGGQGPLSCSTCCVRCRAWARRPRWRAARRRWPRCSTGRRACVPSVAWARRSAWAWPSVRCCRAGCWAWRAGAAWCFAWPPWRWPRWCWDCAACLSRAIRRRSGWTGPVRCCSPQPWRC